MKYSCLNMWRQMTLIRLHAYQNFPSPVLILQLHEYFDWVEGPSTRKLTDIIDCNIVYDNLKPIEFYEAGTIEIQVHGLYPLAEFNHTLDFMITFHQYIQYLL